MPAVDFQRSANWPKYLRDDVGRKLIFDAADLVAQDELSLFQPLYLNKVGTGRGTRAAMAASRSRCSCSRRASCSRNARSSSSVIATAGIFAFAAVSAKARQIIAFSTRAFKLRKIDANQRVCAGLPQSEGGCTVALVMSLR